MATNVGLVAVVKQDNYEEPFFEWVCKIMETKQQILLINT